MPDNVPSIQFIRNLDYETGFLIHFTFNGKQLGDSAEGGTDYRNIPPNFLSDDADIALNSGGHISTGSKLLPATLSIHSHAHFRSL